ncbi:MAG TPA: helix-turn-helix domain-containing protein [Desulfotignum sp.]|nr:helix-turn-helix domain-containing protein [Desulfotignum sp.]
MRRFVQATLLGIHRTLLYKKMKKYGIGLTPE